MRTTQKLDKLGGIDNPYLQEPSTIGEDWKNWSSVEYPDIYNYLIQTPGLYTGESLKTYIISTLLSVINARQQQLHGCFSRITAIFLLLIIDTRESLKVNVPTEKELETFFEILSKVGKACNSLSYSQILRHVCPYVYKRNGSKTID